MPTEKYTNLAVTSLNGSINNSTTSITVATATLFPSGPNFRIVVDTEVMLVTAGGSGTTSWTVVRGYEGSTAASHANGAVVANVLTAGALAQTLLDYANPMGSANLLHNSSFLLAQRQTPGTLTTVATDKYGADRFRMSAENASFQYRRVDTAGAREAGITSRYYGQFEKITSGGKVFVAQPHESHVSFAYSNRVVTIQTALKVDSAATLNLGLIYWTSTSDSLPATWVTTWNSSGTHPTLATNLAYANPITAYSGSTATGAIQCSATTSWQTFGGTWTVPNTANNFAVAVWSNASVSAADAVYIAQPAMYLGDFNGLITWVPKPVDKEVNDCQRFYEKNYQLDDAPGTSYTIFTAPGCQRGRLLDAFFFEGTNCHFATRKRTTPTVKVYSTDGTIDKLRDNDNNNRDAVASTAGENKFLIVGNNSLVGSSPHIEGMWTADAEF